MIHLHPEGVRSHPSRRWASNVAQTGKTERAARNVNRLSRI